MTFNKTIPWIITFIFSWQLVSAQNSVSIGTTSTNSNAVLWLNSPGKNQGLIIPIVSNKSAVTPVAGMIVFDESEKKIYYYNGTAWEGPLGNGGSGTTYTAGSGISIVGTVISNTGDTNANDDITTTTTANGDLAGTFSNLQINSGAIINSDISTIAAIAGTKVTPNFGTQNISTTGTLSVGASTSLNAVSYTWPNFQAVGTRFLQNDGTGTLSWVPSTGLSSLLTSANIFVGNGSNVATGVPLSGDASLANTGAITISNNAITSAKIADGTIADTDVSTTAAIAGTKITPNFGTQNISTTGTLSVGASTSLNAVSYTWPNVQAVGARVLQNDGTGTLSWVPSTGLSSLLTSANIFVGNGSNVATGVPLSGDATLANTGAITISNNAITSAKIADGTIADTDVSATAAIAGTKITPNFGTQNISTTGNLTSGLATVSGLTVSGASTSLNAVSYTWPNVQAVGTRVLQNDGTGTLSWVPSPGLSTSLTSANIFVGNGSNVATGVPLSGDASLANTGAITISNNAITSAKINDGTIADADVSATAAIAGTKVSPNFGTQNISTTGNLTSGLATVSGLTVSGASTSLNAVSYTWPNAQAVGARFLQNDGTGTLSWVPSNGLSTSLTSANIFVGNGSNVATGVPLSGDASLANTGAITISNNAITSAKIADGTIADTDVSTTAAIAGTKVTPNFGTQNISTTGTLASGLATVSGLTVSGASTSLNAVSYTWPNVQAVGARVLQNDGTGTLSWVPSTGLSTSLTSANIYVGNGSNVATGVPLSGDATLANTGAITISNNAITSAKIADGTIADVDVSATAAIAGTKITPNFGTQNISTTGTLSVGASTSLNSVSYTWPNVQAVGARVLQNDGTGVLSWVPSTGLSSSLTSANIFVGNGSNLATGVPLSGDASLANTGAITISNNAITSAKINDGTIADTDVSAAAAIAGTKITPNFGTQNISTTGTLSVGASTSLNAVSYTWPNAQAVGARVLQNDGTGVLSWVPSTGLSSSLTSANIFVGNGSNVATGVPLSGDASLANTGAITISNNAITSAKIADGTIADVDVSTAAAIAGTKITPNFGTQNISTTGTLASGLATVSGLTVSGASTSLNAVSYTWPNVQAVGTRVLQNDGTGTLSWVPSTGLSTSLTSANIFVGNGSNIATGVPLSGDATLVNTGTITISNNAITSAKINDGTIADADVSATAAIAGTKITPNFGTQNISTTGTLSVGASTSLNAVSYTWPNVQAVGTRVLQNDGTGTLSWVPSTGLSTSLTSANIFVGNGSNVATGVPLSGDASLANTGAITISNNAITSAKIADGTIADTDVSATAAIAGTKITPNFGTQNISTTGTLASGLATVSGLTVSGASTSLNAVSYTWPNVQAVGARVLQNDGTGVLSWVPSTGLSSSLTSANIFVGNGSNLATGVPLSGDASLANTGAITISNNAITSAKINDGTIADADVSATAAIAGTKITPNFGTQNISTTGTLSVGSTTASNLTVSGTTTFNSKTYSWPSTALVGNTFLRTDATGNLSWVPAPASFSTNNIIPKGDGTGLVASSITDMGSNISIGGFDATDAATYKFIAYDKGGNPAIGTDLSGIKIGDVGGNSMTNYFYTDFEGAGTFSFMNGKVGIGTANPTTAKLVIAGSSAQLGLDLSSTDQYADMRVIRNSLSGIDRNMYLGYAGGPGSGIILYSNDIPTLSLFNSKVGIGVSSEPIAKLEIQQVGNTVGAWFENASTAPATLYLRNRGTGFGIFSEAPQNGGNSSWLNSSDARLKKNIEPLKNALQNVLRMRGVSFDWRHDVEAKKNLPTKHQIGVIAQEVQEVYPEVVATDPDGFLAVGYSNLVPVLIEAIKEQQQIIDNLKSQTDELKKQLAEFNQMKRQVEEIRNALSLKK